MTIPIDDAGGRRARLRDAPLTSPQRASPATGAAAALGLAALLALAGCGMATGSAEEGFRDPTSASRMRVAAAAEESGQLDIALSMYAASAAAAPEDPLVQARYADILVRVGQPQQADQVLSRALQRRSDNAALLLAQGRLRLATGSAADALTLFDRVLARQPSSTAALNGRGVALYQLGHPQEAEQAFRTVLAAAPNNVAAANNLGTLLYLEGRPGEAVAVLSEAARRGGAPPRVANNLGIAQAASGDRGAAEATLGGRIAAEDLESLAAGLRGTARGRSEGAAARPGDRTAAVPASRAEPEPMGYAAPVSAPPASAPVVARGEPEAPRLPMTATPQTAAAAAPPAAATIPVPAEPVPPPPQAAAAAATSGADAPAAAAAAEGGSGGAKVQLASVASETAAQDEWRRLAREFPELLQARQPLYSRYEREGGGEIWRVRTDGFSSLGEAREFCARMRAAGGRSCLALRG